MSIFCYVRIIGYQKHWNHLEKNWQIDRKQSRKKLTTSNSLNNTLQVDFENITLWSVCSLLLRINIQKSFPLLYPSPRIIYVILSTNGTRHIGCAGLQVAKKGLGRAASALPSLRLSLHQEPPRSLWSCPHPWWWCWYVHCTASRNVALGDNVFHPAAPIHKLAAI